MEAPLIVNNAPGADLVRTVPHTVAEILKYLDDWDATYKDPHPDFPATVEMLKITSANIRSLLTTVPPTFPSWKEWTPTEGQMAAALFWLGYLLGCDVFLDHTAATLQSNRG